MALEAASVVLFVYFVLFVGITLVVCIYTLILLFSKRRWEWDIKKVLRLMIPVGLIWRAIWLTILVVHFYETNENFLYKNYQSYPLAFLFGGLPLYWSTSEYLLVWVFWAFLLSTRRVDIWNKVKLGYVAVNGAFYAVWLIAVLHEFLKLQNNFWTLFRHFERYFVGVTSVIMSILFLIVGPKMYLETKSEIAKASYSDKSKGDRQLNRVVILSVMCFLAFLVRGLFIISYQIRPREGLLGLITWGCYIFVLEMLPELVILLVLQKKQKKEKWEKLKVGQEDL